MLYICAIQLSRNPHCQWNTAFYIIMKYFLKFSGCFSLFSKHCVHINAEKNQIFLGVRKPYNNLIPAKAIFSLVKFFLIHLSIGSAILFYIRNTLYQNIPIYSTLSFQHMS